MVFNKLIRYFEYADQPVNQPTIKTFFFFKEITFFNFLYFLKLLTFVTYKT